MKCPECGADIYEGVKKCPYCKTPTEYEKEGKFKNFDFKYTITSPEVIKSISNSGEGGKTSRPKKKSIFKMKIRRKRKPQKTTSYDGPGRGATINSAEKAREMAKSASRRAAEFIPEGNARYNIRGVEQEKAKAAAAPSVTLEKSAPERQEKNTPITEKRSRTKKKSSFKFDKAFLSTIGAAVVGIFVLVVLIASLMNVFSGSDEVVSSYTYLKDNGLFMVYKGRTHQLSQQVICDSYVRYAEEKDGGESVKTAAKAAGLVKESKDGRSTYFLDNFDPETNSGTLKLVERGKAKKIIQISPAAHNSFVLSKDGREILYIETADENGDMGVLYYWNESLAEPFKIASDIDHGTFTFAGDDQWVVFIQNFNRVQLSGDLYAKNLTELKEEKIKVDTGVCKVYGMNPGSAAYIYAKDYDASDKTFDIYAINKKGRTIRLGERTQKDPLMQKTKDKLFVYGISEDQTSNLYTVDIDSGKKEKIASGVHNILMLSKDEKTVLYDKVYTGKLADYYAYTKGKQPQMVASNVVVDYEIVGNKPQMAVSPDLRSILYISEFEGYRGGGTLKVCTYKKGNIISEQQISDDVFGLFRTKEGRFLVAKDYSITRKVFDLYLYEKGELVLLKEEVSPERFAVSPSYENVYVITNYGVEGNFGTLEKINLKGEAEVVEEGVLNFEVTPGDDILIYKNLNTEDGKFDINIRLDGKKKVLEIDSGIDKLISY